jgi:hypothetical protein
VGKVVRDRLGVQLLLRRMHPDALMLALDTEEQRVLARELRQSKDLKSTRFVGIAGSAAEHKLGSDDGDAFGLDAILHRPFSDEDALDTLERVLSAEGVGETDHTTCTAVVPDTVGTHAGRSTGCEHTDDAPMRFSEVATDREVGM